MASDESNHFKLNFTPADRDKVSELMEMESLGRLSDIRFQKPEQPKLFDVMAVFFDYLKEGRWILFVLMSICLVASIIEITAGNLPSVHQKDAVNWILCSMFFAWLYRFGKNKFGYWQTHPVVLEVYAHGLWFNWENLFVPYERLQAVRIKGVYQGTVVVSARPRFVCFEIFLKDADIKALRKTNPSLRYKNLFSAKYTWEVYLPGRDSVMSMTHEDIVTKIQYLATRHNQQLSIMSPLFSTVPPNRTWFG